MRRLRRANARGAFWSRLWIVAGYAAIAGFLSSVTLSGVNVIDWWDWSAFGNAAAVAGASSAGLSLAILIIESMSAPIRLAGRPQLLAAAGILAVANTWNAVVPVPATFQIPPQTWVAPALVLGAAYVVALVLNAVIGARVGVRAELAGDASWKAVGRPGYLRRLTTALVFAVALALIAAVGYGAERAAQVPARVIIRELGIEWIEAAVRVVDGWWTADLIGYSSLTVLIVPAAAACLALVGVQKDVARRAPRLAAVLVGIATLACLAIVLSSPWQLAAALTFMVTAVIGMLVLAAILALGFAMLASG